MDKKILIFAGIAIVILVIAGIFIFGGKKTEISENEAPELNNQEIDNSVLQSDLEELNQLDSELEEQDLEIIEIE